MCNRDSFAVVLPAAGSGKRYGAGDKLLVDLAGKTVLQRAVGLFAGRPEVAEVIIVTGRDRFEQYRDHLAGVVGSMSLKLVEGGRERWESVLFGLRAMTAALDYVAVHDAARPLTPAGVIQQAFDGAVEVGGAVPVVPEPATLKRLTTTDGRVKETIPRAGLFQAQTPQCFRRDWLLAAYEALLAQDRLADVTDDAQIFERVGRPVKGTPGSPLNMKITTAEDILWARSLLKS